MALVPPQIIPFACFRPLDFLRWRLLGLLHKPMREHQHRAAGMETENPVIVRTELDPAFPDITGRLTYTLTEVNNYRGIIGEKPASHILEKHEKGNLARSQIPFEYCDGAEGGI
jgi:hypothetical protein